MKAKPKPKPKRKSRGAAAASVERGRKNAPARGAALPPSTAVGDDALAALRGKIDAVDERIQALIAERAGLAKEVGILKGLKQTVDYYRPEREAQVLRKVVDRNDGPLRDEEMVRLFRELMSACLAQEEPLKVAYLGPEGTFTQSAVFKHFGHSVHALAVPTVDEVFHEVESGTADFGVAPIENSSEGTVNIHTLDMFLTSPLKICGEIELRIHQHLMGRMQDLKDIKRVCSHPQSLAQCRGWLSQHLPDVEKVPVVSNAEAARRARDEEGTAALAGEAAAKAAGLRYYHIPFNGQAPDPAVADKFLDVMRQAGNQPAFIHCAGGSKRIHQQRTDRPLDTDLVPGLARVAHLHDDRLPIAESRAHVAVLGQPSQLGARHAGQNRSGRRGGRRTDDGHARRRLAVVAKLHVLGEDQPVQLREDGVLRLLGDAELQHALRGDLDGLAGRGVAALTGLAVHDDELADTREREAVACFLV